MLDKRQFYIDGAWTAPAAARDCNVIDPSTEEPCAVISLGSQADTDAAVAAAKAALPGWSATPPGRRRALVEGILAQYEARSEDLAHAISLEMGSPIDHARSQQATALPWHLKNFLTAFDHIEWIRPLGPHAPNDRIAMEPIGVGRGPPVVDGLCRILP
jgi:aldehyde dehydrogenase (NAD+)